MLPLPLIQKYNVPVPRYTSYPTVPFWSDEKSDRAEWVAQINNAVAAGKTKEGISLYIHLPFCEQLCTYCGCNKRITKNHLVEEVYIQALLKEWSAYKQILGSDIILRELHLGGGTPTFFSPEHLTFLITEILQGLTIHPEYEFSFEGHPNNTTAEHLRALYKVGFRRVSFGVQDLDIRVQTAINRIQPFEKLEQVTAWARATGYHSVNFDLVYGLPFQSKVSLIETINNVMMLKPERIAFYSYAHVPWTQKSQRAYNENDLPKGEEKYALYQSGKELFKTYGYEDVGMDHFALKGDNLLQSKNTQTLHRNFMGYTTATSEVLIGLGVSAISDVYFGYRQNYKTLEAYYSAVNNSVLPIFRGIDLDTEDMECRRLILAIACKGRAEWSEYACLSEDDCKVLEMLQEDGLILLKSDTALEVTELGWDFLRNICVVFDKRMQRQQHQENKQMFSQAV